MSARDDYPAVAILADAALSMGQKPESVRMFTEIESLRAELAALKARRCNGCVHWDRIMYSRSTPFLSRSSYQLETCRKWHMFIAPGFAGDFSCAAFEALKPEQLKGEEA